MSKDNLLKGTLIIERYRGDGRGDSVLNSFGGFLYFLRKQAFRNVMNLEFHIWGFMNDQ